MIRRSHLRGGPEPESRGLTQGSRGLDSKADIAELIKRTELTLRRYGVTAAFPFPEDPKNPGPREYTNLQWTKNFSLVDMGSIHVRHVYKNRIVSGIDLIGLRDDNLSPSAPENVSVDPKDEDFVQAPDPRLAASVEDWGRPTWLEKLRPWMLERGIVIPDAVSYRSAWLAERFELGISNSIHALEQHCALLVPQLVKLGRDPKSHTSTKNCSTQ